MKDYYAILGVPKTASQDEIKKAFRKLAHEHHPDKGGDAAKFKEANEAYSVLGDQAKRKQYDTFGSAGPRGGFGGQGGQGFGGFDFSNFAQGGFGQSGVEFDLGDVFSSFFGGGGGRQRRGKDVEVLVDLPFKEATFGTKQVIELFVSAKCATCEGHGTAKGHARVMCKECGGKGKKATVKQTMLGAIRTVENCSACHGAGTIPEKPCADCKGSGVTKRKVRHEVDIPAGTDDGDRYVVRGAGEAIEGGPSGDLIIIVRVRKDKRFQRDGADLVATVSVPLSTLLVGGSIPFETLDGAINLDVPAMSRHGEEIVIRNKGVPHGRSRGDLRISIDAALPKKPSKAIRELAEKLKEEGN